MAPDLPDRRALGLPEEPYSAYCRVCWQGVYGLWIEREPHNGVCPFGADAIGNCQQAMDMERIRGEVKKHLRSGFLSKLQEDRTDG